MLQDIGDSRGPGSDGIPITKVAKRRFRFLDHPFLEWVQFLHYRAKTKHLAGRVGSIELLGGQEVRSGDMGNKTVQGHG